MILNAINLDSKTVEVLVDNYALRATERNFEFEAHFHERAKDYNHSENIQLTNAMLMLMRKKIERLALYAVLTGGSLGDPRHVAIRLIDSCIEEYYGIQKKANAAAPDPLPIPIRERDSSEMVCEQSHGA